MRILFISLFLFLGCFNYCFANNTLGETIYKQSCQTCHNPSTAALMKAPAVHDVNAWQQRMDAAKILVKQNPEKYKNAMAVLVATVKNGKGAMIAGGMCQNPNTADKKCTDEEYTAAINYMMSDSK